MIEQAIEYMDQAHVGQYLDHQDVEYTAHTSKVGEWVSLVTDDEEVITAALLHDVLKETGIIYAEVANKFSRRVADLIASLGLMEVTEVEPAVYDIWLAEFIDDFTRIKAWGTELECTKLATRISVMDKLVKEPQASELLKSVAQALRETWAK